MKIYIPYYENCSWHTATLNSLECNLYNGDNVYKLEVEKIEWKNRK